MRYPQEQDIVEWAVGKVSTTYRMGRVVKVGPGRLTIDPLDGSKRTTVAIRNCTVLSARSVWHRQKPDGHFVNLRPMHHQDGRPTTFEINSLHAATAADLATAIVELQTFQAWAERMPAEDAR